MNRRGFLQGAGAVAAFAALPDAAIGATTTKASGPGALSILQGLTTATTTQLSVDVEKSKKVVYTLTDVATKRVINPQSVKPLAYGSSSTRVDKLKFVGLELGHKYQLRVRDAKSNKIIDDRFLSTVDLNKEGAKIALMSCMDDSKSARTRIWASAEAANVDYMFFLGDNVYGDKWLIHGPSYLWSRYISTRKNVPYYHWKTLKPVIAVWDDHDYGKNNADGSYKYKDHAYSFFKAFFAQEPDGETLVNGYGNSSYFRAFNQNFIFFDNRYYRGLKNSAGEVGFLGREQIDWMSKAMASNSSPTIVMQGSPLFGRSEKGGSYQHEAPQELEYFLRRVRGWNAPVLFAAGDLHYSEVSSLDSGILGYKSHEIISSSMHSSTKSKFYDNPNKKLAGYLSENFIVLQAVGKGQPVWKATCVGKDKVVPFKMDLQVG